MKKTILSIATVLTIAVTLLSCSSSPKPDARKFLDGFYHLDIAAAKTVATEDTKKMLDGYEQMNALIYGTTIKEEMKKIKVDVKEPKVDGNNATVDYTLSIEPGTVKTLKMVKQGDSWKADFSMADAFGGGMIGDGMNGSSTGSGMNGGSTGGTPDTALAPAADPNMGSAAPMSDTARVRSR